MGKLSILNELWRGLPMFREEYRTSRYDDESVKQILRDKRTHILATCMAAYPTTPTNQLAEEFGINPKTINALAKMYGIKKSAGTRSKINSDNGKKSAGKMQHNRKTVEKVARNGRVVRVFNGLMEAAKDARTSGTAIGRRCRGIILKPLNGYRYRYKKD